MRGDPLRARERGLTLVELMVSLMLSSLVVAGGYAMLLTQQRFSRQQTQVQASQQGLWTAMELIRRDVRRAGLGFGSCRYQEPSGFVNGSVVEVWRRADAAPTRLYAITVTDGGAAGTDELLLTWGTPPASGLGDARLAGLPFRAWEVTSLTLGATAPEYQAEGFMYPTLGEGGCDCGGGTPVCAAPDGTAARPFPLALLFNPVATVPPTVCSVVQVTDTSICASGNMTLSVAPQASAPWNRAGMGTGGQRYDDTTQVLNLGDLTRTRWYVDAARAAGPRLMRETTSRDGTVAQVAAEGIEDLQLAAGCDANADGVVAVEGATDAARQSDEWFHNAAGESVTPASSGCLTFPQLRVSLVARTSAEDPAAAPQARPALENHAAATVADRYRRRVLSAVVLAPNVGI